MSLETVTQTMSAKVSTSGGIGASVKFDCGDDGVIFIDGAASSVTNDNNDADCTVKLDLSTLEELVAGETDPTAAFMMGKIKVEGDMSVAMQLSSIL